MSAFNELQVAFINSQSHERSYWNSLVKALVAFGEQFVKYLELPSPTFLIDEQERSYVAITQSNDIGVIKTFDAAHYEVKERSIPFTITVRIPDAARKVVREVSINLNLSAQDGKPGFYSSEFIGGGRLIEYRTTSSRPLMDEILKVLKAKAEAV